MVTRATGALQDNQKKSYVESARRVGDTAQETFIGNVSEIGNSIINGLVYNEIAITYPTTTTEIFVYKKSSVTVATVTITYVTSDKIKMQSIIRT